MTAQKIAKIIQAFPGEHLVLQGEGVLQVKGGNYETYLEVYLPVPSSFPPRAIPKNPLESLLASLEDEVNLALEGETLRVQSGDFTGYLIAWNELPNLLSPATPSTTRLYKGSLGPLVEAVNHAAKATTAPHTIYFFSTPEDGLLVLSTDSYRVHYTRFPLLQPHEKVSVYRDTLKGVLRLAQTLKGKDDEVEITAGETLTLQASGFLANLTPLRFQSAASQAPALVRKIEGIAPTTTAKISSGLKDALERALVATRDDEYHATHLIPVEGGLKVSTKTSEEVIPASVEGTTPIYINAHYLLEAIRDEEVELHLVLGDFPLPILKVHSKDQRAIIACLKEVNHAGNPQEA